MCAHILEALIILSYSEPQWEAKDAEKLRYWLEYENQGPFNVELCKHSSILLGQISQERILSPKENKIPGVEGIGVL